VVAPAAERGPAALRSLIASEVDRWSAIVRAGNIRVE
jgi:hypothetical protein